MLLLSVEPDFGFYWSVDSLDLGLTYSVRCPNLGFNIRFIIRFFSFCWFTFGFRFEFHHIFSKLIPYFCFVIFVIIQLSLILPLFLTIFLIIFQFIIIIKCYFLIIVFSWLIINFFMSPLKMSFHHYRKPLNLTHRAHNFDLISFLHVLIRFLSLLIRHVLVILSHWFLHGWVLGWSSAFAPSFFSGEEPFSLFVVHH